MLKERVDMVMGGVALTLLKEKAVWIAEEKILILSDVHLGKSEHLRKHGVAVPVLTPIDFEKIDLLISRFMPQKLVFLGDLFHSSLNSSAVRFSEWRKKHPKLKMILAEGNHDLLSDTDYISMDIEKVEKLVVSNLILQHHPDENNHQSIICGHIHPGVLLQGSGKQSIRLPCFYKKSHQLILPAFGSSTGLYIVRPSSDSEVFAITPSGIAYYSAVEKF